MLHHSPRERMISTICNNFIIGFHKKNCHAFSKTIINMIEVCGYYRLLMTNISMPFPWKIIQRTKVPQLLLELLSFSRCTLGKILTIDYLQRHIIVVDWCYMCKCNGETMDHLLLHFPIATDYGFGFFEFTGLCCRDFWICQHLGKFSLVIIGIQQFGKLCLIVQ